MTESREQLLRVLIAAEAPAAEVVAKLAVYGWDSEDPLAILELADASSVLDRYLQGELDADAVEAWAEAVESREDIAYRPSAEALLIDVIFELANPGVTAPLSREEAARWLQSLRELERREHLLAESGGVWRWFRVTRYDPSFRDERGAYTRETWTSVSDVGRAYDGEVLALEEYERVERLYVGAVSAFADAAGVETFAPWLAGGGYGPAGEPLVDGQRLSLEETGAVVASMLREEAWCRLEGVGVPFAVHVGYDLYLFIGTSGPTDAALQAVEASGLFVDEDFPSPYI